MADMLAGWDAGLQRVFCGLGRNRLASAAALLLIALTTYLPGVIALPPVDRTEVIYAESTRDMVSNGRWTDPRYAGQREVHRPIGTFWLQAVAVKAFGADAARRITAYRLPSLAGVLLAVMATWWMLIPVLGGRGALISAGIVAVTPIAALQANLAVTEGITFGPATVAQLSLLRIYVAQPDERSRCLSLLFWLAQGVAIALNAFAVPLLSLATLAALWLMDRHETRAVAGLGAGCASTARSHQVESRSSSRFLLCGIFLRRTGGHFVGQCSSVGLLRRLEPHWGVPLAVVLGSPWPLELVMSAHGWPYGQMTWRELLGALGGSQAMKFGAPPLSFTLGFVVGMLPVTLLLWPALRRLWDRRDEPLSRFLFAWIAGYWVYLELISSKPALYTVQVMFPAAAAAVALLLARDGADRPLRLPDRLWAWPGLIFVALVPVLYFVLHRLMLVPWSAASIVSAGIIASLLGLGSVALIGRRAALWLGMTFAGFAAFLALTLGGLLPRLDTAWTSDLIAKAMQPLTSCVKGPVAIVGITEPSTIFRFGAGNVHLTLPPLADGTAGIAVVHAKQDAAYVSRVPGARPLACIETVNFTRGCIERFTAYAAQDAAGCRPEPRFACGGDRKSATLPGKLCH